MAERPHRKLVKCHVLFLGDSTPEESSHGLRALQQPLMKCYPVDSPNQVEGIDSWLTIFTSGILLQYVGNKSDSLAPIWFPIQNLHLAAATKCVNYIDGATGKRMETEFVDINNPAAEQSSHPPLFSIIVRKTAGKRILRSYTFLVRDEEPAVKMVDAAKYAFTHESGWSNSHPPDELIRSELVPGTDDPDDVDQFDSVSAAGRKPRPTSANTSQSESEAPTNHGRGPGSFPSHLVKKYTLTNTNRGGGVSRQPSRRPIPSEFLYHSSGPAVSSIRSGYHGGRIGPPPIPEYMLNGSGPIPGSLRSTTSVRVIQDPRTRAPMIEKVIREPVPVPVPVYQPPPPPKVIHQVKPIYIPQPPEIRHVQVDREVPVPVEVPVPYPVVEEPRQVESSKHSHKRRSHKHHTFKNYQVYDDRFSRREQAQPSYFVNGAQQPTNGYAASRPVSNGYAAPYLANNGYFRSSGEHIQMRTSHKNASRRGRRNRSYSSSSSSSSSSESSEEDERRHRKAYEYDPFPKRRSGGIEITELSSPDERSKQESRESKRRSKKDYRITEVERDINRLNITAVNGSGATGPEFKWSAIPSDSPTKEERKAERRRKKEERRARQDSSSPDRRQSSFSPNRAPQGQVYIGAEPADPYPDRGQDRGQIYIGADAVKDGRQRTSLFRQNSNNVIEELKERKGKGKKKRDKSASRVEDYPDYNGGSTSKEYYFKEHTENPPRNWMDQKKEYMNERAFSSSLANDPDSNITNAYALNRDPEDETMLDREMPAPPPPGDIPPAPPLPAHMTAGGANLY